MLFKFFNDRRAFVWLPVKDDGVEPDFLNKLFCLSFER